MRYQHIHNFLVEFYFSQVVTSTHTQYLLFLDPLTHHYVLSFTSPVSSIHYCNCHWNLQIFWS